MFTLMTKSREEKHLGDVNTVLAIVGALGLGAALMYILDPEKGKRRRSLMRDKCVRALHKTEDAIGVTSRDLSNRARGLVARVGSRFRSEEELSDDVLVERLRSEMGRIVSHPSAIEITANQGNVTLRGPILASEVNKLVSCISRARGVTGMVDNQLEVHETPGDVPALQGAPRRDFATSWSPTARLLLGTAGCVLAAYGARRHDAVGATLGTMGICLAAQGISNVNLTRRLTQRTAA